VPRRLDIGPLLAAFGAVLLLISLFLNWYEPGLSAWTVFEVLDLVLAVVALATLAAGMAQFGLELPLRDSSLPLLGGAAFVIVVSQIINHPPAAQGGSPQAGAWLALGSSVVIVAGGLMSAARVSVAFSAAPEREAASPERTMRRREPAPDDEAAAAEPEVQEELYPEEERRGPIGVDDPEPWTRAPEDETIGLDVDREREEEA
jgi:hypothetical protein